jgi:hypothetical protein
MYIVKDCIYIDPKKSDSKFYAFEPFWNLNVSKYKLSFKVLRQRYTAGYVEPALLS